MSGTPAQARAWGEDRERDLIRKGKPTRQRKVMTVAEFAPLYISGHHEASLHKASGTDAVKRVLEVHILPFLAALQLDQVKDEVVAMLRATWLKGGYETTATGGRTRTRTIAGTSNRKTHNNRLSVLSAMLKVAVDWHGKTGLLAMPCRIKLNRVDVAREPAFYDHGDYERLVVAAGVLDHRLLAALLLAGDAGLRRGEIMGLDLADVDFANARITVRRSVWVSRTERVVDEPKGMKRRPVPLTPRLFDALKAVRHLRGSRVFYDDAGAELTPKTLRTWVERIERQAGLPVTGRIHVMRHTFCSHGAMAGVPAMTIKDLARHSSLATTMRYMHLSPSALDDGIAMLDESRKTGGHPVKATRRGDV